jgi:hypothetical protein
MMLAPRRSCESFDGDGIGYRTNPTLCSMLRAVRRARRAGSTAPVRRVAVPFRRASGHFSNGTVGRPNGRLRINGVRRIRLGLCWKVRAVSGERPRQYQPSGQKYIFIFSNALNANSSGNFNILKI